MTDPEPADPFPPERLPPMIHDTCRRMVAPQGEVWRCSHCAVTTECVHELTVQRAASDLLSAADDATDPRSLDLTVWAKLNRAAINYTAAVAFVTPGPTETIAELIIEIEAL